MPSNTETPDDDDAREDIDKEQYEELTEELSEKIQELSELQKEIEDENTSDIPDPDDVLTTILNIHGFTDIFDIVPGQPNNKTTDTPITDLLFGSETTTTKQQTTKSLPERVTDGVDDVVDNLQPNETILDELDTDNAPVTMNLIKEIVAAHPDYTLTSHIGPDDRKYIMLQLFDNEPNPTAPSEFVRMVSELQDENTD